MVGGDGANWIDTASEVFARVVRQRDGFHLARDAARGWGSVAGATLYTAVRTGDQPTTREFLALSAPPPRLALPPPAAVAVPAGVALGATAPRRARWSRAQVARARTTLCRQIATPDAAADWRTQVSAHEVPPGARALGTQEGTNAHLLARRMKRRGMSWTVRGAQAMGTTRELVTNGTLATWCLAPAATTTAAPRPMRLTGLPDAPPPWPQIASPAAHGPPRDATVAHLQRVLQGGYRLR